MALMWIRAGSPLAPVLLVPALSALLAGAAPAQEAPPLPDVVSGRTSSAACSAFLPEDRPLCADRLSAYHAAVEALEARRARAEPTAACLLHCDLLEENWKLRKDTQRWSERAIRTMASGAYDRRNEALASAEARRAALREERTAVAAELAELRRGRVIHLYQDDETGNVVEHAGEHFEPRPPLRYVGEKRAPQLESGQDRIAEREARLAELDAELVDVRAEVARAAPDPARVDATEEMIHNMWGDVCTEVQMLPWLDACRSACHGAPDPGSPGCRL